MHEKEFFQAIRTLNSIRLRTPKTRAEEGFRFTNEKFNEKNIMPGVRISSFMKYGIQVRVGFFYMYENEENRKKILVNEKYTIGGDDHFKIDYVENHPYPKDQPGSAQMFITDFQFCLSPYPACCGLKIFHHFSSPWNSLDDEQQKLFNEVMVYLLKYIHKHYFSLYASRLEAVFVSGTRPKPIKGRLGEPVITEKATFNYSMFRKFFQQTSVKTQSHSFYNYNSGSTLEKSEAVFDSKMFPMY